MDRSSSLLFLTSTRSWRTPSSRTCSTSTTSLPKWWPTSSGNPPTVTS